jgi:hypothetical protein
VGLQKNPIKKKYKKILFVKNSIMSPSNAVVIVVGGASEAADAVPGKFDLTLKRRKGFVKLAIQKGFVFLHFYEFFKNQNNDLEMLFFQRRSHSDIFVW